MSGFETRIEDAAVQWREANRILKSYVDHKLLDNTLIVSYENLVKNTKVVLNGVLNFCNLNNKNYNYPKFITDNNEKQIARLSAYEIDTITKVSPPMLTHFGYDILS